MKEDLISETVMREVFSGKHWVSVYGVGYVGLSLIAVYLRNGLRVIGVDIDEQKLKNIQSGGFNFRETEIKEAVRKGIKEKKLALTSDGVEASKLSKIKVVTVPINVEWQFRTFNFNSLKAAVSDIGKGLKPGDLVIIESSVPPGTTRNIVKPILESISKLSADEDFYLAYSPERVYIGHAVRDIELNYPKVIGGIGPRSSMVASKFYMRIAKKGVIKLSNTVAAEFEKLAEGVYRDVNIALANELAIAAMKLGVDFFEVRKAANSQPYSHIHLPGPGVGGYCIPLYPYFILNAVLQKGYIMEITRQSRRVNETMPQVVIKLLEKLRYEKGLKPKEIKAAILGVAFRGDIDDTRLSPSHDIISLMKAKGYSDIVAHDPLVTRDEFLEELGIMLIRDINQALKERDAVIIATKHTSYINLKVSEILSLTNKESIIVDSVNALHDDIKYKWLVTLGKPNRPI